MNMDKKYEKFNGEDHFVDIIAKTVEDEDDPAILAKPMERMDDIKLSTVQEELEPEDEDEVDLGNGFANPLAAASAVVNSMRPATAHSTLTNGNGNPFSSFNSTPSLETAVPMTTSPFVSPQTSFDQIEVSLVEDGGDIGTKEVLENASDFFLEHNDNYTVTWDEASHRISEVSEDPSKPPLPGWNLPYARWRLRRLIESLWFRALTMILIIIDIIIVIIDLSTGSSSSGTSALQILDFIFTIYFVIEISLRIFALTHQVFFSTWYNVVDFAVVLITFIVVCTSISGSGSWAGKLTVITVLRFVRIFRLVRLYTEKMQIETAARQMVSQNKRRYQQDGFDLDLTYVTARIIATSFPSSGLWARYRNPIEKVAAFLDSKHEGKYRLYNLCSERTYNTKFFHDRVERVMIDDHNVPTLEDMLNFAKSVKSWLNADPDNVIVVHCKGGKGRTGTMICVWLVESEVFSTADQSLEYFGQRRTDTNVSKKFQGVETPSQSRYVGYFEIMKNRLGGQLPAPRQLMLKEIHIRGMMYVGQGNGDDFWFTVNKGRGIDSQVFSAHIGFRRNCTVQYDAEQDLLKLTAVNCPVLEGDTRILFQTASKTVPKGYEECPFYFWFNTAFVPLEHHEKAGGSPLPRISLARDQIDNPHKSKTWHCFREQFRVDVIFEEAS